MPNGRSGGFLIETEDLKQLVNGFSDTTVVGKMGFDSPPPQPASAAQVSRFIEE